MIATDPNLLLIAGPCVLEDPDTMLRAAERVRDVADRLGLPLLFKSSFLKDNRSTADAYEGPGMDDGLRLLERIKREVGVSVTTDIHTPDQAAPVAEVVDVLQIPAFLCMQTSLLAAAARTGLPVNVKHGQSLAPERMAGPVAKLRKHGCAEVLLTERGVSFGYDELVVDPRAFGVLRDLGCPVIFDVTHALRSNRMEPGRHAAALARAGVAAGVDGVFVETHPDPASARSDAGTQLPLDRLEELLRPLIAIHEVIVGGAAGDLRGALRT